ncbi:MAG: hypothetical protein QM778_10565 [Myxococcales bacterium]
MLARIGVLTLLLCITACDTRERLIYVECPDDAGDLDAGLDGSQPPIQPAPGSPDSATPDSSVAEPSESTCPPLAQRTLVDIKAGVLSEDRTRWTCDHIYVLNGIVFVASGDLGSPQVLTIEPGTVVRGQVTASARGFLVVTRTGRIEAEGTRVDPIVFTSANPVGSRARDDWGGITLLGAASTGGTRRVEGFPATVGGHNIDDQLAYGPPEEEEPDAGAGDAGTPRTDGGRHTASDAGHQDAGNDAGQDSGASTEAETGQRTPLALQGGAAIPGAGADGHDCGTLRYVRVEFASFNAGGGMGNESNGIQLYACGYRTVIDHVQVHLSGDDGVEVFGGSVDFSHLLITGASDDSFDWDDGWRGRAQFLIAQQYPDAADLGFEAGGTSDTPLRDPDPRIFNATWIGTNNGIGGKVGGRLRGGSRGYLRNQIFMAFNAGAIDIGGSTAAAHLREGTLSLRNSVFWMADTAILFPSGAEDTADDGLDEMESLSAGPTLNRITDDPRLIAPYNYTAPNFVPAPDAALGALYAEQPSEAFGDTRPPFFDLEADFVGAIEPGGEDWTRGWTAFPPK